LWCNYFLSFIFFIVDYISCLVLQEFELLHHSDTQTSWIIVWISTMVTINKKFNAAMHAGCHHSTKVPACSAAWINYAAELSYYFIYFLLFLLLFLLCFFVACFVMFRVRLCFIVSTVEIHMLILDVCLCRNDAVVLSFFLCEWWVRRSYKITSCCWKSCW